MLDIHLTYLVTVSTRNPNNTQRLFAKSQLFGCNNEISSRYFWYLLIVRHKMVTWFHARTR